MDASALQSEQLWAGFADAGEICMWHCRDVSRPIIRIQLKDCAGVVCMIKVKKQVRDDTSGRVYFDVRTCGMIFSLRWCQIWVGCHGRSVGGKSRGKIYIVNTERCAVEKELIAHTDCVQTLCSAEDRYVLSGAGQDDGKIGIWKVE